jgi:hypothetical protein
MAEELAATLEAIDAVHSVLMESSLPEWLQDQLVNSVSHVRNGYWFANSSCPLCVHSLDPKVRDVLWRQFEAFDCTDLDSIHNDGERALSDAISRRRAQQDGSMGAQSGTKGVGGRGHAGGADPSSEKDAESAQKLGQLQPVIAYAIFPLECMGQLVYFGPT